MSETCRGVGENGAGKSTLIRCVTGVIRADAGGIELDGRAVEVGSPREAARLGIAAVHQEAACCPALCVAENMLLPDQLVLRGPGPLVCWPATYGRAQEELTALGAALDMRQLAGRLSAAEAVRAQGAADRVFVTGDEILLGKSISFTKDNIADYDF